jgi:hypothetical protein
MATAQRNWEHSYQLVLRDDGIGMPRTIKFEASGADAALFLAQRECAGREAELFEDDRSLGKLKCDGKGGFWMLSASAGPTRQA